MEGQAVVEDTRNKPERKRRTSAPYRQRRRGSDKESGLLAHFRVSLYFCLCGERRWKSLRHSSLPPTSANYTPALNSQAAETSAPITHAVRRAAMFPISPSHHQPPPTPTPSLAVFSLGLFQPTLCSLQFFGLIGAEPWQHT